MKIKTSNSPHRREFYLRHKDNKPFLWVYQRKTFNPCWMIHLWILGLYIGFFSESRRLIVNRSIS